MNGHDEQFLRKCLPLLKSPCLEVGAALPYNARHLITESGLEYSGADIEVGPDVTYRANFEDETETLKAMNGRKFNTVLALNILEHTFDPLRVLDNLIGLLNPGGVCVIITPVIWPLHSFPMDCWRINPNLYEEYARRRNLILSEPFEYLPSHTPVRSLTNEDGSYKLPDPTNSRFKSLRSKIVHRVFRTTGRGVLFQPHVAIGVVFINSVSQ
jgi:SAM-dependent methyltransferase